MMSENYEFMRKIDYSEDTMAEIKYLCDTFKDLLIIPNEKCFILIVEGISKRMVYLKAMRLEICMTKPEVNWRNMVT